MTTNITIPERTINLSEHTICILGTPLNWVNTARKIMNEYLLNQKFDEHNESGT